MNKNILFSLFIAGLVAFSAAGDGDSNGSDSGSDSMGSWGDSFENKDEDCDRLVDGSDDNDGKCDLTDGLEEVPDKVDCTPEQKTTIINWITILKSLLSVKVSVEERLTIALSSIQKFQSENPDCYELIQYQNISSWGFLASFTKVVEYRQSTKIESIMTLDDEDNCPLFEALMNGTDGSYEQESACRAFINETLIGICGNMSLSITERSVLIYKAISEFFAINSEWQMHFFQFQISGFGSFQQFYEITRTYYQKTQVDVILEGEASECSFIVAFKNQLEMIKSDSSISMTVKKTLIEFEARIEQQISMVTSGKARLSIIIKEFNSFFQMYTDEIFVKLLYSISINDFGNFMDLIYCGPYKNGIKPKPTIPMATFSPKPTCSCTCEPLKLTTMA